jgi:UDP-N-acetylmuramate--alanine ligase
MTSPGSEGIARIDLSGSKRVHIVGAGGAGMSAIASVLQTMGHEVTGSDLKSSPAVERLSASGVDVSIGHDGSLMEDAQLLAVSTAIRPDNPEVLLAASRGIRIASRAEILAAICALRRVVAISGTHGKTTTTTLVALVFIEAGLHPSFLIGGDVNEIGTNAVWDRGEWLVVEADESDSTFLALEPQVAVVTSIEADHLDHYGEFSNLVDAFDLFCARAGTGVVANADDPVAAEVGRRHGALLVGKGANADLRIVDPSAGRGGVSFGLERDQRLLGRLSLPVSGANLADNAATAAAVAISVGIPLDAVERAFARFAGVSRRFEHRGEAGGVRFVDDYAHLPTEVKAVIEAARSTSPDRLVVVFQPHRYSRAAALYEEFGGSFEGADAVVVTDIYPAGEDPVPGVTGKLVADAVMAAEPGRPVHYVPRRDELARTVRGLLRPGDLCLTLGAGDLTGLPDELLAGEPWW